MIGFSSKFLLAWSQVYSAQRVNLMDQRVKLKPKFLQNKKNTLNLFGLNGKLLKYCIPEYSQ